MKITRLTAVAEKNACVHKLVLKKSAKKELDRLSDTVFQKIDTAILSLKDNPYPFPHSKKLEGENKFRLRVGDNRVVYDVHEKDKTITICRIRHRKEVYR